VKFFGNNSNNLKLLNINLTRCPVPISFAGHNSFMESGLKALIWGHKGL